MHNSFWIILKYFSHSRNFSLYILCEIVVTNYKSKDKTQLTSIKLEKVNVKRKSYLFIKIYILSYFHSWRLSKTAMRSLNLF